MRTRGRRWNVLPHEWAFNGFLLLTLIRLLAHGAVFEQATAGFLAFLLTGIALIAWTEDQPTPTRWRVRLLWYPSVMGLSFYTIPGAVRLLGVTDADALLAPIDESLLGLPAADYFLLIQSPVLTDLMCAGYVFFFVYLIVAPGHYCVKDLRTFRACIVGMFTTYALGFLGYTVLPAGGPYQALHFFSALPTGPLSEMVLPFINRASNGVDVFPSIHAAISLYLLMFDRRHCRWRYELFLLPVLLLWLSTVYLRYHYAVDLVGGAVIAGIGLGVAWLYQRSSLSQTVEQQALVARFVR